MTDDRTHAYTEFLDEVRRNRGVLAAQIKHGRHTLERSKEVLKRMDELIANAEKKGAGDLSRHQSSSR